MSELTEVGEWQGNATVKVGDIDLGYFQKRTGGAVDSEEAKWGSGGMEPETARGGRRTRDNVVLTRPYSPTRDGALYARLVDLVGRGRASGTDFVLDIDGNVKDSVAFKGVLKKIDRGDYDDTSKDQRDFIVEISADAK
jgi:hypothetical protein